MTYAKFLVALGAAAAATTAALADGKLSVTEGVMIVVAFIGALGVRQVTNTPPSVGG